MKNGFTLLTCTFAAAITCCTSSKTETTLPAGVGINLANMDTTVNPADNFFEYVNGGWVKDTPIPSDQGRWGSFNELAETTRKNTLEVLKAAATNDQYKEGSPERKAADFFAIGMDSTLAEKMGITPIKPYLDKIGAIRTTADVQDYLASQVSTVGGAFFGVGVNSDLKKSDVTALYIGAGGIGLPERDYYAKDDDKSKEIREKYVEHIRRMLIHSGVDENKATSQAKAVMEIETKLAMGMLTKEERRNPDNRYNKRSISQLAEVSPALNWENYFDRIDVKGIDSVIVSDPGFLKAFGEVLAKEKIDNLKTYLRWRLIDNTAPYLNHELVAADFDFFTKYLRGIDAQRPRWKRVLDATTNALGEAIGKLYVEKHFPPEAKQKALELVDNVKIAFGNRIKNLDWMSDTTKEKALKKLSTFNVKIGYPDEWRDYSKLTIEKSPERMSYATNVLDARQFEFERQIAKLGKPVDRKEWRMTPHTVNAYYNSVFNEIVFPAAILQPPFYDYRADAAVNYGGIGAVIGHEISHGFDDQGSKFDAEGNLKNWWLDTDLKKFQEKGKAYAAQFDKYEPLPGVFVQGQFTLGENIGDLGGVAVAYDGLQLHLKEHGNPGLIDGFTPEQRFFISWATIWRSKYKDETLRTQVLTDPHAPGMYRANGPLTNFEPFYQAFGVKEGDKMFRPESERVKIW